MGEENFEKKGNTQIINLVKFVILIVLAVWWELMELDSIECVSSSDGMDEDEIHSHHHHHSEFSSTKARNGGANINNILGPTAIAPATSVHELLECPVCTNSMYPPIHQVCFLFYFFELFI